MNRVLVASLCASLWSCGETPQVRDDVSPGVRVYLEGTPDFGPEPVTVDVNGERILDDVLTRSFVQAEWDWGPGPVSIVVTSERAGTVSFVLEREQHAGVFVCQSRMVLAVRPAGTLEEQITPVAEACAD